MTDNTGYTDSDKISAIKSLALECGCKVLAGEPLSAHTTFKVGGKCDIMVFPKSPQTLSSLILKAEQVGIKYFVMGNGSNVLFRDEGYAGAVFVLGEDMSEITVESGVITASAGATLSRVCKTALEHHLGGMEFAWGIPGTVGGAVYMNAGAFGGEMKDVVKSVTCIDKDGNLKTYSASELDFGYRSSRFTASKEIIVSASFALKDADYDKIKSRMDELIERRRLKQPLEYPSAGSTFKRPEGTYAGLVIENSGLKGYSVGGAQVSEKHANFVINKNGATAADIIKLISDVKRTVKEKTGYDLECEIKLVD